MLTISLSRADINISPQVVVSCDKNGVAGCHGGDSVSAYAYVKSRGVTDETCSVYQAADVACSKKLICETCNPRVCSIPDKFYKYTVSAIGQFKSENNAGTAARSVLLWEVATIAHSFPCRVCMNFIRTLNCAGQDG